MSQWSEHHWLFGYGSIVNEESRLRTLAAHTQDQPPPAAWVELSAAAGFVREWNFRAPSGFTAVGLRRAPDEATEISGVLFEAGVGEALRRFDERETGYERVELDPSLVTVLNKHEAATAALGQHDGAARHRFWTYVPMETNAASEEHPICQTYVDVCLLGCLERGGSATEGRQLAVRWVLTTGGWSRYWLNDAPMSRRPWLHRPRHGEIDAICREHNVHTQFDERRHPEEFSGRWMGSLRGMWGVPPRNSQFVGRDTELGCISAALAASASEQGGGGGNVIGRGGDGGGGCVSTIELVGMGGVGKTQLATEFCYRHFAAASDHKPLPSLHAGSRHAAGMQYGLVVWLRAESAEALAADLRALAIDSGIGVQGLRNEEVVDEVRARLYRARAPWLLVFDNVIGRAHR